MTNKELASESTSLINRITDYLGKGGLFNPEAMKHDKVRDLLIDIREYLIIVNDQI